MSWTRRVDHCFGWMGCLGKTSGYSIGTFVLPTQRPSRYRYNSYINSFSISEILQCEPSENEELVKCLLLPCMAFASACWLDRPRGWIQHDLLEVKRSNIPNAGEGVFAKKDIPRGTVLGQYPGRARSDTEMTAKVMVAPLARQYCFMSKPGILLDPTDGTGRPSSTPVPGAWWPWKIDYTLSLVNEPPKGAGGTTIEVVDDPHDRYGLLFVADKDISQGDELYIDYGLDYDRSHYMRA